MIAVELLVLFWQCSLAGARLPVLAKARGPKELQPDDLQEGDHFGHRICVDGNLALISAIKAEVSGVKEAGKAHLYDLAGGSFIAQFTPPDPQPQALFGSAVALSGDRVLVSAPVAGGDYSGAAYLFHAPSSTEPTGTLVEKLRPPDIEAGAVFGISVALGSMQALVGASQDSGTVASSGAAYLFEATSGMFLRKLLAPDAAENDLFGFAVAKDVHGHSFVSAVARDSYAGAVYMYDRQGGFVQKLAPPSQSPDMYFGNALAVSGNRLLVGAPYDSSACGVEGKACGSAYLLDVVTGNVLAKVTATTPSSGNMFGNALAISQTTMVVAGSGESDQFQGGSVQLFDLDGKAVAYKLDSPSTQHMALDTFASHVALSDDFLLVGAVSFSLQDTGMVYALPLLSRGDQAEL